MAPAGNSALFRQGQLQKAMRLQTPMEPTGGRCRIPQTCIIGLEERYPTQSAVRASIAEQADTVTQMLPRSEAEIHGCMALPTIGLSKGLAAGGHQAAVVCTPAAGMQSTRQQNPAA